MPGTRKNLMIALEGAVIDKIDNCVEKLQKKYRKPKFIPSPAEWAEAQRVASTAGLEKANTLLRQFKKKKGTAEPPSRSALIRELIDLGLKAYQEKEHA